MGATRRRGSGAAVAVAAVALAGAVVVPVQAAPARPAGLPAEASYEQAVAAVGACAEPRAVRRWAEARETLAAVRHWREVVDFAAWEDRQVFAHDPVGSGAGPRSVGLRVSDGSGTRAEAVVLDDAGVDALGWALRSGARAYLALTSVQERRLGWLRPGQAAYVLLRHPDGRHLFAGACAAEALTAPARAALGPRFDRAVAGIVGRTGSGVLRSLR